jgi:hypothetical protein
MYDIDEGMESCREVEDREVFVSGHEGGHNKSSRRSKNMHGPLSMVNDHVDVPFEGGEGEYHPEHHRGKSNMT